MRGTALLQTANNARYSFFHHLLKQSWVKSLQILPVAGTHLTFKSVAETRKGVHEEESLAVMAASAVAAVGAAVVSMI